MTVRQVAALLAALVTVGALAGGLIGAWREVRAT